MYNDPDDTTVWDYMHNILTIAFIPIADILGLQQSCLSWLNTVDPLYFRGSSNTLQSVWDEEFLKRKQFCQLKLYRKYMRDTPMYSTSQTRTLINIIGAIFYILKRCKSQMTRAKSLVKSPWQISSWHQLSKNVKKTNFFFAVCRKLILTIGYSIFSWVIFHQY